MHNAARMCCHERARDLRPDVGDHRDRQRAASEQVAKALALDVLKDDIEIVARLFEGVYRSDIRVRQGGGRACFLFEALTALRIAGGARG